jgi:large subunit ribosomal protein L21
MYAVFRLSGFQYRVENGTVLEVPFQDSKEGSKITISDVLLVGDGEKSVIGTPLVDGAQVEAKVLEHFKSDKTLVFKMKRRTKYRRIQGHRQDITKIQINKITAPAKK